MKKTAYIGMLVATLLTLAANFSMAQVASGMTPWDPNLNYFSLESNLPWNAPCSDCEEDTSKRTLSTREFRKGSSVWTQASLGALHYVDASGNFVPIDPRLREVESGKYAAMHQITPVVITAGDGNGFILSDGQKFIWNKHLILFDTSYAGLTYVAAADWTNYTVGDNGMVVYEIFPGIDLKIIVAEGAIESDFIIKAPLYTHGLVIRDHLTLPDGYTLAVNDEMSIILQNEEGDDIVECLQPIFIDASGSRETPRGEYRITENMVDVIIDSAYLQNPARVYPIIIDPLVTSTATYTLGSLEMMFNGSFCAGPNSDCTGLLSVPRPANCTLTGATLTAEYRTVGGGCAPFACWMSDAGFFVSGPCANYPVGLWLSCISPGGDATGNCSGAGINIFNTVSCLTPACSGNVNYSIYNSYCFCNINGTDCTGALPCQRMNNNTWIITLSGRTVEVLGSPTGSGSLAITMGCWETELLNPTPLYGVGPYTYLWSTGATTSTTTFYPAGFEGFTVITCVVTDACGVAVTATFNITSGCLLPIELTSFEGFWNETSVQLEWVTASEGTGNFFAIERSISKTPSMFTNIAEVEATGGPTTETQYVYEDKTAQTGTNYYRLRQVDLSGASEYSATIPVEVPLLTDGTVYPNPTSGRLLLRATNLEIGQGVTMIVTNTIGEQVYKNEEVYGGGLLALPTASLPAGSYIATFVYGTQRVDYPFIRQ